MVITSFHVLIMFSSRLFFMHEQSCVIGNFHSEKTSVDLTSEFKGLSMKYTCRNQISCNFHVHLYLTYVIL